MVMVIFNTTDEWRLRQRMVFNQEQAFILYNDAHQGRDKGFTCTSNKFKYPQVSILSILFFRTRRLTYLCKDCLKENNHSSTLQADTRAPNRRQTQDQRTHSDSLKIEHIHFGEHVRLAHVV